MEITHDPKASDNIGVIGSMYPTKVGVFSGGVHHVSAESTTSYGYVLDCIACRRAAVQLRGWRRRFFSILGELKLDADGRVFVIQRHGFVGMVAAGRVEEHGRLSYIDTVRARCRHGKTEANPKGSHRGAVGLGIYAGRCGLK